MDSRRDIDSFEPSLVAIMEIGWWGCRGSDTGRGPVIPRPSEAEEAPGAAGTLANTGTEEPLGLLEATKGS